ncbi:hypothetical protein ACA910_007586 [Epithemia clementina (nom. ined.)]
MSGVQFPEEGGAQQAGGSPMSDPVLVETVRDDGEADSDDVSLLALAEDFAAGGDQDAADEDENGHDESGEESERVHNADEEEATATGPDINNEGALSEGTRSEAMTDASGGSRGGDELEDLADENNLGNYVDLSSDTFCRVIFTRSHRKQRHLVVCGEDVRRCTKTGHAHRRSSTGTHITN